MTETYCIKEFKELSTLPNSSVAKATLEKLISATKMLLVKRLKTYLIFCYRLLLLLLLLLS